MTHEQAAKVVADWMRRTEEDFFLDPRTRQIERKLAEAGASWDYSYTLNYMTGRSAEYTLMTATEEQRILAAAQTIESMGGEK